MVEAPHIRINLPDRSYQAIARSEIKRLAESVGFKGHRLGEMEIIIAEMTSNLSKHSHKGGYLLVRLLQEQSPGIEIISVDNGPGMKIPSKMMEDGHSTTKTLGQGLGAIRRLAGVFDLYSINGWGTILMTRTYVDRSFADQASGMFQVAALSICKPGQLVCGDGWKFVQSGKRIKGLVMDGLGHGKHAHEATAAAVAAFLRVPDLLPTDQLLSLHQELKKTRGAVINVVHIDMAHHQIMYSGVGNIAMKVITPSQAKGCFSYNGIVGHIMPAVLNNHSLQWEINDTVVLHTDGISSRWDINKYPAIMQHHPMVACAALYKDFDRGTDDSTIVVGKFIKAAYE